MLYAVFAQRLQQHARHQHIQALRVHLFFKTQLLAKPRDFDRQVILDKVQLIAQRTQILVLAQQAPQDARKLQHHETRLMRIGPNQRGYRIQGIEQEVGIDLAGERLQPRLHEQPLLFLQLVLIARVVQDLERQHDGEKCRSVQRHKIHEVRILPRGLQREKPVRAKVMQRLPQKFREKNNREEKKLEAASTVISLLEKTVDVQIEERREMPDIFGVRCA